MVKVTETPKRALSFTVGTAPVLQFEAVPQSLLVPPVQLSTTEKHLVEMRHKVKLKKSDLGKYVLIDQVDKIRDKKTKHQQYNTCAERKFDN